MADSKETIRLLESRRYRAMCEGDAKTLEELLADSLVYTHSYGGADSKASYLDGIRSKKWIYQEVERPIEDIQVHGDCAVVAGPAVEMVGTTVTREQDIVSRPAKEIVVPAAAGDAVVAPQTVDDVAEARPSEVVGSPSSSYATNVREPLERTLGGIDLDDARPAAVPVI